MKFTVFAALAAAAIPAAALAVQPAPALDRPMQRVQTRATIGEDVRALFARLDVNRDGYLARDEVRAGRTVKGQRAANRAQRRAGVRLAGFDRLDLNRDGVINRQEFGQAQTMRQQRRAARPEGVRGNRGLRAMRFGGRMFDLADINRDARVSIQEATAAAYQRFDLTDVNRDGRITPDERRQGRDRLRAQPRRG